MKRPMIVGKPVVIVVDLVAGDPDDESIPLMDGYGGVLERCAGVIGVARECEVPVVYLSERHRRSHLDFGRELDGAEDVHLLEGDPGTELDSMVAPRPDDPVVVKRRYSGFFGTDLEIVLKGLRAQTLVLVGCLTDVCVHYTFLDCHQNDYYARVVDDCVIGSGQAAHDASLAAMEYLQTGARRSSEEIASGFRAWRDARDAGVAEDQIEIG